MRACAVKWQDSQTRKVVEPVRTSRAEAPAGVRYKLTVNVPGDVYEQEADRVAGQVMSMPEPLRQRTCACGGGCPVCRDAGRAPGRRLLQTKQGPSNRQDEAAAPPLIGEVLSRTGQPLDASTRNFMQPRFGLDFSRVRLHTDSLAAEAAKAVNARAFTVGNDIVFGAAEYVPNSKAGLALLAHELTHVAQQNQPGGSTNEATATVQRQPRTDARTGTGTGAGSGAQAAGLRRAYIELACQVIADIRAAVEEGRIWYFENDFLLQGEEWLRLQQPTLVQERNDALMQLVQRLDRIIGELESGALTPTAPASRYALHELWDQRNPISVQSLAQRWSPVVRHERLPSGQLQPRFPSLSWYIAYTAGSPPGMLRPAPFPTWWVTGCEAQQPERPPAVRERLTPPDLDLSRDTLIYVGRTNGVVTSWQWEPRIVSAPEEEREQRRTTPEEQRAWHRHGAAGYHPVALGTPYEWHYDEAAGRVFIVVDGRQVNLLRHGRVELQR